MEEINHNNDQIPLTPIELIKYDVFDVETMAYLMLAAENEQSMIVVGPTASGKTTTLKSLGMLIPETSNILSMESPYKWYRHPDELSRRNPGVLMTDNILGKEDTQSLFKLLNQGHATWSTLHASSMDKALQRLRAEPMNVAPELMKAIDLVIVQELTKVDGENVRRLVEVNEITEYSETDDELTYRSLFERDAEADEYHRNDVESDLAHIIKLLNGWSDEEFEDELAERKRVLQYLCENGISEYQDSYPILCDYVAVKAAGIEASNNTVLEKIEAGTLSADYEVEHANTVPITPGYLEVL